MSTRASRTVTFKAHGGVSRLVNGDVAPEESALKKDTVSTREYAIYGVTFEKRANDRAEIERLRSLKHSVFEKTHVARVPAHQRAALDGAAVQYTSEQWAEREWFARSRENKKTLCLLGAPALSCPYGAACPFSHSVFELFSFI